MIKNPSQLALAFFGLTSDQVSTYRKNLFKQIHDIVFHGKGGYDWNTVYSMPIWLRKFIFHEINQYYKEESEAIKKAQSNSKGQKNLLSPDGKINLPNPTSPKKSSVRTPTSNSSGKINYK